MTSAAERVGKGLAPARDARPILPGERIHVVGAAGAGASAAALLARSVGARVTACDPGAPSIYTPALEALGIAIAREHSVAHVTTAPAPDRLAVTKALTAIHPDQPELVAARSIGILVEPWQQVVADVALGRTLVGVAGTHGKSTTAGWLVHVLVEAGLDPTAFVGALLPAALTGGPPATARWGRGAAFIVEADEYAGNFDPYRPDIAILTSAEWDHPDVFADGAAVEGAFEAWLRRAPADAALVANVAEPGVAAVVERLVDWPGSVLAYALVDQAPQRLGGYARAIMERFATRAGPASALLGRVTASDPASTTVEIYGLDPMAGPITTRLTSAGRHNAANALAVAGAASVLGLAPATIGTALASFAGVGRRLERKGEAAGVTVYDDYGFTRPPSVRRSRRFANASRVGASGPSWSRSPFIALQPCLTNWPRPWPRPTPSRSRTFGPVGTRTRRSPPPPLWPTLSPPDDLRSRSSLRARWTEPRTPSQARSAPATLFSSWAAARATGSRSGCSGDWRRRDDGLRDGWRVA